MGEPLAREIAARLRADDSLEAVTAALERLGEAEVVALIESTLASGHEHRLERLARASYEHAFGFKKLVLLEEPGVCKVRLHAWPRGARESDVHDHRWNFCARVLRGGYRFEEYEIRPGEAWCCYRYLPTRGEAHFTLQRLGTRDVECVRRGTTSPGSVYAVGVGTAHRVWTNASVPTLSLMLQGPDREESTTVLTRGPRPMRPAVDRLDPARYRQCLEELRGSLLAPSRPLDWVA